MTKEQFAELAVVDPFEAYDNLVSHLSGRFAVEKAEAADTLKKVRKERWSWRYERVSWAVLAVWAMVTTGICLAETFFTIPLNAACRDRADRQEGQAKTYRLMLLENRIDPETGKVFGK